MFTPSPDYNSFKLLRYHTQVLERYMTTIIRKKKKESSPMSLKKTNGLSTACIVRKFTRRFIFFQILFKCLYPVYSL